jgi:hypothetical protein
VGLSIFWHEATSGRTLVSWESSSSRYLLRRICESDRDAPFRTGFRDFDEFADLTCSGTLRDYQEKDQLARRPLVAYLLVDSSDQAAAAAAADHGRANVLGVLRYCYEGDTASRTGLASGAGAYIYLSRIGIADGQQRARLGAMLFDFFLHLVIGGMLREGLDRVIVWCKCVERSLALFRPWLESGEARIFARPKSQRWGEEIHVALDIRIKPAMDSNSQTREKR